MIVPMARWLIVLALLISPTQASEVGDWAPSEHGEWLAFVSRVSEPAPETSWLLVPSTQPPPSLMRAINRWELWIAKADGSEAHRLFESADPLGSVAWHPTGRHLAYLRVRGGRLELVLLDRVDREHVLASEPVDASAPAASLVTRGLAWHPQGEHLAATVGNTLRVVDVASGRVLHERADSRLPSYSRDGDQLAFAAERGRDWMLYAGPATLAAPLELGLTRLSPQRVDWLEDGRVGFWSVETETDERGRVFQFQFLIGPQRGPFSPSVRVQTRVPPAGLPPPAPPVSSVVHDNRVTAILASGSLGASSLWTIDIERPEVMRRWHPLRPELPIACLAGSADGSRLAMRVGHFDASGTVLVSGMTGAPTKLITPSPEMRLAAAEQIALACERLLQRVGPPPAPIAVAEQQPAAPPLDTAEPTRLPAAEIVARLAATPSQDDRPGLTDLARLAHAGHDVLDSPDLLTSPAAEELRFLFAYLVQDWNAARQAIAARQRGELPAWNRIACRYLEARLLIAQDRRAEGLLLLEALAPQIDNAIAEGGANEQWTVLRRAIARHQQEALRRVLAGE
jgi:hypothetical protein